MDKTIAEPLAFLVLSAWPLALLMVFLLGIFAIWRVVRRAKDRGQKWKAGFATAIIVILIPTWDVIAGRIQYGYLCATESGIRVYKRVKLEPEYRGLQLADTHLEYDPMPLSKRFPFSRDSSEDLQGPGKIKFNRELIRDSQTGEILGTFTSYFWGGGWFERMFSIQGAGGGSCGYETGGFRALVDEIFEVPR